MASWSSQGNYFLKKGIEVKFHFDHRVFCVAYNQTYKTMFYKRVGEKYIPVTDIEINSSNH